MTGAAVFIYGYTVTRMGASIWPRRTLKYCWAGVVEVRSRVEPARGSCETEIRWKDGARFVIGSGRSRLFWGGAARHCEALALVLAGIPSDAKVDAKSRHLARWGTAEVARRIRGNVSLRPDPTRIWEVANHRWARGETRASRQAFERLLAERPDDGEAARSYAELLVESGAKPAAMIPALENWRRIEPQGKGWREHLAFAYLAIGDERGAELMRVLRVEEPANLARAGAIATYHLRRGEHEAARAVCEDCLAHTTEEGDRRNALRALKYVSRWGRSGWFRAGEKGKGVALLILPWAFVVLVIGFQLYGIYARRERLENSMRQNAEWEQKRRDDEDRRARKPDGLTGWVSGSMEKIREAATEGNAAAQYTLGARLISGLGLAADPVEGLQWLERAAAQDNAGALRDLGHHYSEGRHVPEDLARAFDYYRRAADLGSPRAAYETGDCYRAGRGVEADAVAAARYFRRAAEGGNVFGQYWLGWCLETGKGVAVDRQEALKWYRAAATKKNIPSALRLAAWYGEKTSPVYDRAEAFRWLEVAGDAGSKDAQLRLGLMLSVGVFVPQDLVAAQRWLEKAAKSGVAESWWLLGEFDWQGVAGPKNPARAVVRWEEAAKRGLVAASERVVICRMFGLGVAADRAAVENDLGQFAEKDPARAKELRDWVAVLRQAGAEEVNGGGDRAAEVIVQPRPFYPVLHRLRRKEGTATIGFVVNAEGRVTAAKIERASEPEFGIEALAAVELWRFRPAVEKGRPVSTRFEVPVVFTLNEESKSGAEATRP